MGLLTPISSIGRPLHVLLIAELPILLVTLALLSWGISVGRDAVRFQELSGEWDKPNEKSGFGFEYGTQEITQTTTRTGTSWAYSVVPSTRTRTAYSITEGSTASSVVTEPASRSIPYAGDVGTFTSTVTYSIYPYIYGTAFYSDQYANAEAQPSDLRRVGGATSTSAAPSSPTSAPVVQKRAAAAAAAAAERADTAEHTPAQRRDASFSDGYNYYSSQDGFYQLYDEAKSDLQLWIGCFAGCLAAIVLRLLATCGYLITAHRYSNPSRTQALESDKRRSIKFHYLWTNIICGCSSAAVGLLLGLGLAAFIFIGERAGFGSRSASVIATLVFYALSTLTTFTVLVLSCVKLHRVEKERKAFKRSGGVTKRVGSDSSIGHA